MYLMLNVPIVMSTSQTASDL